MYCTGELDLNDDGKIVDFTAANSIANLFKIKEQNNRSSSPQWQK